jgi:carboxylate-amine ligase
LIDFGLNETAAFPDMIEELIELIHPDAVHFGCEADVAHLRKIVTRGTSAERQLKLAGDIPEDGQIPQDTLDRVVDQLMLETQQGL